MHTIGNHGGGGCGRPGGGVGGGVGNNRRSKGIFHNPRDESLVHISTLLTVLLTSFCDEEKFTIGVLIKVFLHTGYPISTHWPRPSHHSMIT